LGRQHPPRFKSKRGGGHKPQRGLEKLASPEPPPGWPQAYIGQKGLLKENQNLREGPLKKVPKYPAPKNKGLQGDSWAQPQRRGLPPILGSPINASRELKAKKKGIGKVFCARDLLKEGSPKRGPWFSSQELVKIE